jgi:hypothetical protein
MTGSAWAEAIGAELDAAGLPTLATVVGHVRAAASTEPYLLRSRITRALKESYAPFACEEAPLRAVIHQACEVLVRIGDLTVFQSDGGPGYVATPERLVAIDDDEVAILGMAAGSAAPTTGLVRKAPRAEALEAISAPLISLAEEIGTPDWRLHILTVGGMDEQTAGPAALFTRLGGAAASGERLEHVELNALRVLTKRGAYFGRYQAAGPDGRWTGLAGEGVFCAARRRPFGWQTCVISSTPRGVTAVDVPDLDRWRWAVAGQTLRDGDPIFEWRDNQLQSLTPPPFQIQRLFDLAGDGVAPWRWAIAAAPVDLARLLVASKA